MKLIIVSDNHRDTKSLVKILNRHQGDSYLFLHCGDSQLPKQDKLMQKFIAVKGNNDFGLDYNVEEIVDIENQEKIFLTHGDRWYPELGVMHLLQNAHSMGIYPSIVCYGHTHIVDIRMQDGILIINPGSVRLPRDGYIKTYAQLEIEDELYKIQILEMDNGRILKEQIFSRNN